MSAQMMVLKVMWTKLKFLVIDHTNIQQIRFHRSVNTPKKLGVSVEYFSRLINASSGAKFQI